jgi:hypothetical protein
MLDGPVRTDDTLGMRKARRLGTLNRRNPKGGDAVVRLNAYIGLWACSARNRGGGNRPALPSLR